MHINRGGFDLHLIAVRSGSENEVYGCIYLLYGQAQNSRCTAALKAVRSAFIWHRNRGCTAAVNVGHDFQDFEIKSWVEISCIFTVFSVLIFAEGNNKLSLSLTGFPRGGFSRGYFGQKSLS